PEPPGAERSADGCRRRPAGSAARLAGLCHGESFLGGGGRGVAAGGGVGGGEGVLAGAELTGGHGAAALAVDQGAGADARGSGLDGDLAGRGAAEGRLDRYGEVLGLLVAEPDRPGGQGQTCGGRLGRDSERVLCGRGAVVDGVAAVARGELVGP